MIIFEGIQKQYLTTTVNCVCPHPLASHRDFNVTETTFVEGANTPCHQGKPPVAFEWKNLQLEVSLYPSAPKRGP